ncbi:MAG: hypothetical protein R3E39_20810 [Anaerolineae bacterium]
MRQSLRYETLKPVIYALLLVGVGLVAFGFIRFITLSQDIEHNPAYQFRAQNTSVQQLDESAGRLLMVEDLKLRDLQQWRGESAFIMGAGVVLTALVWLGNDIFRARARRAAAPA